jgi:N6-adenosine-specific RNA methylase IME4
MGDMTPSRIEYFEHGPFAGLPRGHFKAAIIDPPWDHDSWSHRGPHKGARQHYTVQPLDYTMTLPVGELMAPEAVIFLWVVQPTLPEAMRVIEAWGFEYVTVAFKWIKMPKRWGGQIVNPHRRYHPNKKIQAELNNDCPRTGLGYHTRSESEQCWLIRRGKKGYPRKNMGVEQVVFAPVREHSHKPDEVIHRIDQLVGDVPRIELFAREDHEGWVSWGAETGKFESVQRLPIQPLPMGHQTRWQTERTN